jgi:hypothetical protein
VLEEIDGDADLRTDSSDGIQAVRTQVCRQVAHVRENMGASRGALPDAPIRRRMAAYVEKL